MEYPELLEFDNKEYLYLSKPYYRSKEPIKGDLYSLHRYQNDEEKATLSHVGLIDDKSILKTSEDEDYEKDKNASKLLNVTIINSTIYIRFSEIEGSIIKDSNLFLDYSIISNSIIKNSNLIITASGVSKYVIVSKTGCIDEDPPQKIKIYSYE